MKLYDDGISCCQNYGAKLTFVDVLFSVTVKAILIGVVLYSERKYL